MVVLSNNLKNVKETRLEGPANLVIEITSKSTKEIDTEKLELYLEILRQMEIKPKKYNLNSIKKHMELYNAG